MTTATTSAATTTSSTRARPRPAIPLDHLRVLVARSLRTSVRVPQLLMFSLTMPMAMLIMFSQVFRSVADSRAFPSGVSYIDFLTPAMLAVSTVMAGTNAGVAAAIDHANGLYARLTTLPVSPWLPGIARMVNEIVITLFRAGLLLAAATAMGFRFHGTIGDALAGLLVIIALASAMSALFGEIGDHLRRPDVVQFAGMMIMMPLMFLSAAFAPLSAMPDWIRAVAALNPVEHAVEALRGHALGTATTPDTASALTAAAALWFVVALYQAVRHRGQSVAV